MPSPAKLVSIMPTTRMLCSSDVADAHLRKDRQKRFKKLVESGGFALVGGAVVSADGSGAAPVTPKKAKGKKVATPASKKRRVADAGEDDQEGEVKSEDNGDEVEK